MSAVETRLVAADAVLLVRWNRMQFFGVPFGALLLMVMRRE